MSSTSIVYSKNGVFMSWFYQFLDGGILTNLVFLVLAVVSILISVTLYIKSKKEKELVFSAKSFELIQNSISSINNLTIKYGEHDVEALTVTRLSFWNDGKATIDTDDIVSSDKLRIELAKDIKIYTARIEMTAKESNSITLCIIDNKIIINFDFLDYGDGAIINFYHSGSMEQAIRLKGNLKGALPIKPADELESLPITNYIGRFLFRKYWDGGETLNVLERVIACVFLPFAILFLIISMSFEAVSYKFFKKIPKQFVLIEKGANVGKN